MMHSLQLVTEEFQKISKPKIQKLKGEYSANVIFVFNSWLKDVEICVREQKLRNFEAVQLTKDYTTENVRGAVEVYIDTISTWDFEECIRYHRNTFESGRTFSSLVGDFYSRVQWPVETKAQFANELQILSWRVISMRPSWKDKVNEALKIQFSF